MSAPLLIVLRPLGLGDFLTAVPAYRAIARHFPRHHRVLAAPRGLHDLVAATDAFAGSCDVAPLEALPPVLHHANIAIDLHGRGPASHRFLLDANPRRLIAFANDEIPQSASGARWIANEHEVTRWCRMLEAYGIATRRDDLRLIRPPSPEANLTRATIVHPGAASESRRWPLERWIRVVRALRSDGHDVVLSGAPDEAHLTAAIAERTQLPKSRDLGGKTSLAALSAIVAHARMVLSSDTGIAHLAVAHGTPSVSLYGPTSPAHWGPPRAGVHRVLWAGRVGDPHGRVVDPGLLEIDVDDVMRSVSMPEGRAHASCEGKLCG